MLFVGGYAIAYISLFDAQGDSSKHVAITLSRMNFAGCACHATIFNRMPTTACCLIVGL